MQKLKMNQIMRHQPETHFKRDFNKQKYFSNIFDKWSFTWILNYWKNMKFYDALKCFINVRKTFFDLNILFLKCSIHSICCFKEKKNSKILQNIRFAGIISTIWMKIITLYDYFEWLFSNFFYVSYIPFDNNRLPL